MTPRAKEGVLHGSNGDPFVVFRAEQTPSARDLHCLTAGGVVRCVVVDPERDLDRAAWTDAAGNNGAQAVEKQHDPDDDAPKGPFVKDDFVIVLGRPAGAGRQVA